jgi:hypothetical protein
VGKSPKHDQDRELTGGSMASEHTRPSDATKEAERKEARRGPSSDREPTPEESAVADELPEIDEGVESSYKEMTERGAKQEGEGRIP